MKIGYTKSGISMQFTEVERQQLPDRIDITRKDHTLRIMSAGAGKGHKIIPNTASIKTHPWRVTLSQVPFMAGIPYFGTEDVEMLPGGRDCVAEGRPTMRRAVTDRPRGKTARQQGGRAVDACAGLAGLEALVTEVNAYKKRLGAALVLEVLPSGMLRALVQFGPQ